MFQRIGINEGHQGTKTGGERPRERNNTGKEGTQRKKRKKKREGTREWRTNNTGEEWTEQGKRKMRETIKNRAARPPPRSPLYPPKIGARGGLDFLILLVPFSRASVFLLTRFCCWINWSNYWCLLLEVAGVYDQRRKTRGRVVPKSDQVLVAPRLLWVSGWAWTTCCSNERNILYAMLFGAYRFLSG